MTNNLLGRLAMLMVTVSLAISEAAYGQGFSVSFHAGGNAPLGDFGDVLDPGASYGLDVEYEVGFVPLFTDSISVALEGFLGREELRGPSDQGLNHLSLNGKFYFVIINPSAPVRPFVVGGLGVYDFTPGPSEFGFNVGGGVQFRKPSVFAVEVAVRYHWANTSEINSGFLTYQGGIRIYF